MDKEVAYLTESDYLVRIRMFERLNQPMLMDMYVDEYIAWATIGEEN